ncbi:hypothetical protein [Halorubrum saccharovorum]|uniref:hypothetical protein n=1 Tax=Halorubrum saccharovorum TaxID=2248 RepID=UPI001F34F027|nr:hypothetical protein [Halorubrum saccharovorum]
MLNAGDTLLWQLLGAGLLCPLGARWSADAVRRRAAPKEPPSPEKPLFEGPSSALLLTVVLAVYVSNAVVKLRGEAWPAGEAVGTVFQLTYLHGPLGGLMPESPALLAAATYGWVALLVASPLLVASAGRVRAALAGVLVVAHLSMALTLQIGVFSVVSATALIPFFPPFVWDRIESLAAPAIGRFRSTAEGLPEPPGGGSVAADPLSISSRPSDPRPRPRRRRHPSPRSRCSRGTHGARSRRCARPRRGSVRPGRERLGHVRAGAAVDRLARARDGDDRRR